MPDPKLKGQVLGAAKSSPCASALAARQTGPLPRHHPLATAHAPPPAGPRHLAEPPREPTHCAQAFASRERVAELSQRLRGALAGVLPEAAAALRAALPDAGSRSALSAPIAGNVAEALGQLEDLLTHQFPEGTLDAGSVLTRDEVAAALHILS